MSAGDGTRLTLHPARTSEDLRRLGRTMQNCLGTYGRGRTSGRDRIVEVREDGRTRYAVHMRDGRIVMFEGARNRPPRRADVPRVRELLERAGYLHAARAGRAGRRGASPPTTDPPAPIPPAATRVPGSSTSRVAVQLQALAAELLRDDGASTVEWPEVAAALWAAGRLPVLPDPTQHTYERIVLDLCTHLATGRLDTVAPGPAPSAADRRRARQGLLAGPRPDTREGWQRRRMAASLEAEVVP